MCLVVLQYLDNLRQSVHDNLKQLVTSPSVEMQDIPPDLLSLENTEEQDPDIRNHQEDIDKRLVKISYWQAHDAMLLIIYSYGPKLIRA